MSNDLRIDYIEFPALDMIKTQTFYRSVFGWHFTDYGPDYSSFADGRLSGGFRSDSDSPKPTREGVLVVIYADDLDATLGKVRNAGGEIVKPTFDFPGGRRFHFTDPSGNELAVWSDK